MAAGSVDGHGRRNLVQLDPVEQRLHVGQRRHGHAAGTELTERTRVVGVVAVQRGHIKGDGQAGLSLVQQELEPLVGLGRPAEPGEHAARPETPPVPSLVDAPEVGELAGKVVPDDTPIAGAVDGCIDLFNRYLRGSPELRLPLAGGVLPAAPIGNAVLELLMFLVGSQGDYLRRDRSCGWEAPLWIPLQASLVTCRDGCQRGRETSVLHSIMAKIGDGALISH